VESRSELEVSIRDAFRGVRLGGGVSLQQSVLLDDDPKSLTEAEFAAIPNLEVTDDWAAVSAEALEEANVAFLDAEGLRYYLPALMLRLLDHYDPAEMWVLGTIRALDQRRGHPLGFLELLSATQRRAIARYVRALPALVELDAEDGRVIERALFRVWSRYLTDSDRPNGHNPISGA
jgi:hypothetical protein